MPIDLSSDIGMLDIDLAGAPPALAPGGGAAGSPGTGEMGAGKGTGPGGQGGAIGFDIAADAGAARPRKAGARDQGEDEPRPKKRTAIRAALLGSLVIIGGASLTLFPDIGAFGAHFVSDTINASAHASALAELRESAQASLDQDTSAAVASALARARAAQSAAPRYRPTAAYAAYLAFQRSIRFGRRGGDEAYGRQMLAFASDTPSDTLRLALAAQDAASGALDKARQAVLPLAAPGRNDIDALVLLGEIELAAKAYDKAVDAWKRAAILRRGARTLYGLARAQAGAGDNAGAAESARAAAAASPAHPGSRTLLASLLWDQGGRDAEALALLGEITSDSDVKRAASEAELVEAQVTLGRIHLARSRMSAAEQAFAAALSMDPQSLGALLGSGELFYRSGRYTEAAGRFEAAARADDKSAAAKIGLAKTWISLERKKEAKDLLKKVREAQPNDPLGAYWLGRVEEALGNKKEAEAAYLDAIKVGGGKKEAAIAYVALSYLLGSLGRADEASAKLNEATSKFPDLPELHRAKGDLALQAGRYEEAKNEFNAALEREDDPGTRFKLGVALRRMRAFDQAAAVFDKVAAADPEFPGLALERGLLFEETGQGDKAIEMYAEALKKAPTDTDLKLRVGSAQVMAGKVKQAEPILREVVKERPNSAEANHFLGRALLLKGGQLGEATRFLERASEIDPNQAEYFLYVGWAANEAGQSARAEAALRRALELDRELGDAYWQRGVLLQKQGAIVDALADLETALKKRPSRYEAYATMALCYQDQSRWPEAEQAWRKAISGNDAVAEWHYRLGKIIAARGDRLGASAELERAVTLAEADKRTYSWLFDAYFLLGDAMRASGVKDKAITYYRRYLELAPPDNAYRPDVERALQSLGAAQTP